MKSRHLVHSLLLCLLCLLCTTHTHAQDWVTYENSSFGIEASFPARPQENSEMKDGVTMTEVKYETDKRDIGCYMMLMQFAAAETAMGVVGSDAFMQTFIKGMLEGAMQDNNTKLVTEEVVYWQGHKTYHYAFEMTTDGLPMRAELRLLAYGTRLVVVGTGARSDGSDDITVARFLGSVQLRP